VSSVNVVEVDIDGETVLVPVLDAEDDGDTTVNTSALLDRIDAEELLRPVRALGGKIRDQVADLKPSRVTIETGIAVAVRNGKLTALLVDGQADVSFTLTLEWDLSGGEAG
jgi:hypothetical protein